MFDQFLVEAFPGFLSVRNAKYEIIYLNNNFRDWIYRYTDIDPMGKTNNEIAALVPPNVAQVFLDCHDTSLKWEKNCKSTESLKKVIKFKDSEIIEENTQYFEISKSGIEIQGDQLILTVGYDITDIYIKNLIYIKKLQQRAYVDELTGERSFFKFKEDAQKMLNDDSNSQYALIKLDIENFKLINKTFGLDVGDQILKNVSNAIKSLFHKEDVIFSRISVDEFVFLHYYHGREELNKTRKLFIDNFNNFMQENFDYNIKFKIGEYVIKKEPDKNIDINICYELANFAHRQAKQSKDIDVAFYDETFMDEALREKEIENIAPKALQNNEFVVFLQPKYSLEDELIVGAEALVRWQTDEDNYWYPNDFIPVFESNGFITQIDMHMLEESCKIISRWIASGITPVTISVNFSRQNLKNRNFVNEICSVLNRFKIEPKWIEIELTETAIFDNFELLEDMLKQLHNAGFTMSMDDFGSGYSSLGLLKNLCVDVIKIDRSFFVKQENEARSKIVLGSVIDMAKKLGISTVAEGIEEKEHIDLLRELGCDIVQGYYYSRPIPQDQIDALLIANMIKSKIEYLIK